MWQSADITDILKAQQFCADKGGLKEIDISFGGFEEAFCVDGSRHGDLHKYKLVKENNNGDKPKNDPPN